MRVVHVITRLILGGAQENTLHNVEDLVSQHQDEVTLITGPAEGPEGDLFARAAERRLDVQVLDTLIREVRPRKDWAAYRSLRRMIGRMRPDVVHTHSSKAGILGRAAAHACRVPAIVHTIHGLPFHPYQGRWVNAAYVAAERWAAKRCDRIITVADAMRDQAVAAGVASPAKFITIFSGMDVESFLEPPRSRADVRAELGIREDQVVVGKIARLFELKGHDDVISAAGKLAGQASNVVFLFVGGGVWRDRLQERIVSEGLASKFKFTGLVPAARIPELIGAMDVVVHASYREGLARVLPQALISGKPVVSYDVDGAREVVVSGETGFLVPPGDVQGLADALSRLLGDPVLRRRLGREGRRRWVEPFRHETMTARIRDVYLEILRSKNLPVGSPHLDSRERH